MFVIVMRALRKTKMNKFVGYNSYYLPHFCNLLTFNDFLFDLRVNMAMCWPLGTETNMYGKNLMSFPMITKFC